MDIRNIADKGNVDRAGDRTARPESHKDVVLIPHVAAVQDRATISSKGRSTLAAIESLAERARQQGGDRHRIVEAAREKLASGELNSAAVFERAAGRLLEQNFIAG